MFECVQICTVSDTLPALQRPPPSRSTRRGLSGIECRPVQRVQRPGVSALPCMVCLASGTACAAACAAQSVRVRWGLGSPPAGYTGNAGGGAGHARDKIFQRKRRFSAFLLPTPTPSSQNETSVIVQVSKNSEKYKKTPLPV